MLQFHNNVHDRRIKLFRFEAMWLAHENFIDFLSNAWNGYDEFNKSLKNLSGSLINWNKNIFGLVEKRKKIVLARLNGIQKSPAYTYSRFLDTLERNLQNELEEILKLEEIK